MTDFIIAKCDSILLELKKFSGDMLSLGTPITDNRIEEFEVAIGYKLPFDFKYILAKHNSFALAGTEVYGLGKRFGESSIDKVYYFERGEVGSPMFKEFLPFSPDGFGNHYCFDLSHLKKFICPVIFWQHDCLYSKKEDAEICNNNFTDWIREVMIDWTLDDFNYNGSEKELPDL